MSGAAGTHPHPHPCSQLGAEPALRHQPAWLRHLHRLGHHQAVRGAQGKRHHLAKVRRRHRSARSLAPAPTLTTLPCSLSSSIKCTLYQSYIVLYAAPFETPLPALTASKAAISTKRESKPSERRSRALLLTCNSRTLSRRRLSKHTPLLPRPGLAARAPREIDARCMARTNTNRETETL